MKLDGSDRWWPWVLVTALSMLAVTVIVTVVLGTWG